MPFSLKKIHHLIRYFLAIGILVFVGYLKHWQDDLLLILIGPCLYLAYTAKIAIFSFISLPESKTLNDYFFLMPICILYFGLFGFQLKQLWNESGKIRFLSLFALITFVVYIHYTAWGNLSDYFLTPAAPAAPETSLNQGPAADLPLGNNQGQTVHT